MYFVSSPLTISELSEACFSSLTNTTSENQSSKNESSITGSTLSFFVGISTSDAFLFFGTTACSISAVGEWGVGVVLQEQCQLLILKVQAEAV